ncbi:MAG: hypothetical protein NTY46_01710, partial [Candidatus Sumerlaeota bacterium]|nr:hypothetical protein [Candidatus Sumerlaeota bacterium]
ACSAILSKNNTCIYKARLTNLDAGTTYHFRPVANGVPGVDGTFREMSVTGKQCAIDMHAFNPGGSYRGIADTVTFDWPGAAAADWQLYE